MKASLRCWFCDVKAFTKSLIRLDNLSQPVLRRESSGPSGSSMRALESDEKEKQEERALHTGTLLLNCPVLDPPTGGWSNPSVRMGRSPAHVHGFWGHAHVI